MGIHFGIYLAGKAHATRCSNSNLSLPPSGGGRVGWGGFMVLGKIKFVQTVEPLPARRESQPPVAWVLPTNKQR